MPKAVEPDRIALSSLAEVQHEFALLQTQLDKDETEHTWELIDKALRRFHAVVRGGVTKTFPEEFVKGLREKKLVAGFVRSMATERTRLSATALDVLASLTRLGHAFAPLLTGYLPALLRLLSRTNKLYIARATTTIAAIITNTHLSSLLQYVVAEWKAEGGKSATFRLGAVEALVVLLDNVGKDEVGKRVEEVEWLVKEGATDRESKVRGVTKKAWELYKGTWPERVFTFSQPLTPITRRYLNVDAGAPVPAAPPVVKKAPPPAPPSFSKASTVAPTRNPLSTSTSTRPANVAAAPISRPPLLSSASSRPPPAKPISPTLARNPLTKSTSGRSRPPSPTVARAPSASSSSSRPPSRSEDPSSKSALSSSLSARTAHNQASSTSALSSSVRANASRGAFKPSAATTAAPTSKARRVAPVAPPLSTLAPVIVPSLSQPPFSRKPTHPSSSSSAMPPPAPKPSSSSTTTTKSVPFRPTRPANARPASSRPGASAPTASSAARSRTESKPSDKVPKDAATAKKEEATLRRAIQVPLPQEEEDDSADLGVSGGEEEAEGDRAFRMSMSVGPVLSSADNSASTSGGTDLLAGLHHAGPKKMESLVEDEGKGISTTPEVSPPRHSPFLVEDIPPFVSLQQRQPSPTPTPSNLASIPPSSVTSSPSPQQPPPPPSPVPELATLQSDTGSKSPRGGVASIVASFEKIATPLRTASSPRARLSAARGETPFSPSPTAGGALPSLAGPVIVDVEVGSLSAPATRSMTVEDDEEQRPESTMLEVISAVTTDTVKESPVPSLALAEEESPSSTVDAIEVPLADTPAEEEEKCVVQSPEQSPVTERFVTLASEPVVSEDEVNVIELAAPFDVPGVGLPLDGSEAATPLDVSAPATPLALDDENNDEDNDLPLDETRPSSPLPDVLHSDSPAAGILIHSWYDDSSDEGEEEEEHEESVCPTGGIRLVEESFVAPSLEMGNASLAIEDGGEALGDESVEEEGTEMEDTLDLRSDGDREDGDRSLVTAHYLELEENNEASSTTQLASPQARSRSVTPAQPPLSPGFPSQPALFYAPSTPLPSGPEPAHTASIMLETPRLLKITHVPIRLPGRLAVSPSRPSSTLAGNDSEAFEEEVDLIGDESLGEDDNMDEAVEETSMPRDVFTSSSAADGGNLEHDLVTLVPLNDVSMSTSSSSSSLALSDEQERTFELPNSDIEELVFHDTTLDELAEEMAKGRREVVLEEEGEGEGEEEEPKVLSRSLRSRVVNVVVAAKTPSRRGGRDALAEVQS